MPTSTPQLIGALDSKMLLLAKFGIYLLLKDINRHQAPSTLWVLRVFNHQSYDLLQAFKHRQTKEEAPVNNSETV